MKLCIQKRIFIIVAASILIFAIMILFLFVHWVESRNRLCKTMNKTYIKISPKGGELGGRGVFACQSISKGEIIEEGHLLIIPSNESSSIGFFRNYIYTITDNGDNSGVALPLGNGCLYNHSYTNNAIFRSNKDKFKIIAIQDISKDEEIFTCYGCNHPNKERHFDYAKSHGFTFV
jgi:SET domain-containing protein